MSLNELISSFGDTPYQLPNPELPMLAIGFTKQEWKEASSLPAYQALLPQESI